MNKQHLLLIVTGIVFLFSGCGRGATNYKTAYINKSENGFIITLRGKRVLHPAGPIDAVFPKTYDDSIFLRIPLSQGITNCSDVIAPNTYFNFIKGNVLISNDSLQVNLFYINNYDKSFQPFAWNGFYELKSIKYR